MKRSLLTPVGVLLGFLAAPGATAQKRAVDVQLFKPAPGPDELVTLETARIYDVMQPTLSLYYNYSRDPLVIRQSPGNLVIEHAVRDLQTMNLLYSISPLKCLLIGLDLPLHMRMDGEGGVSLGTGQSNLDARSIGDGRVDLKWKILGKGRLGFGLALGTPFSIPLGGGDKFQGETNWTFSPRIIFDYLWDRVALVWQFGYFVRESVQFGDLKFDDELFYGAGVKVALHRRPGKTGVEEDIVSAMLEVNGRTSAVTPFKNWNQNPIEGILAGRVHIPKTFWDITAGVGFGVQSGYGVPQARVFLGFQWTPREAPPPPPCPECKEPKPPPPCPACKACPPAPACPTCKECPLAPACPECPKCAECPNAEPPKKEQIRLKLKKLYFPTGSWVLLKKSTPELERLLKLLRLLPDAKVKIEGHTDSQAGLQYNMNLSKNRAEAVRAYLVKNGIDPKRVTAEGYGPTRPIASNDTAEGRQENRRVEALFEGEVPPELREKIRELGF